MDFEIKRALTRTLSAASSVGIFLVVVLVCLTLPVRVAAQENEQHEAAGEEHEAAAKPHEGGEEHGEEHHLHKHHIALFLGATEGVEPHTEHHDDGHGDPHAEESSGGKEDPGFTLGFDYERRFNKLFGFGGMIDWVVQGNREWLIGPIAFLHPFGGAKLYAAPCFEHVTESDSNEFVFRVGASWDFEVGKFSVGPNLIYDFSDEHDLWVVGIGIGKGF